MDAGAVTVQPEVIMRQGAARRIRFCSALTGTADTSMSQQISGNPKFPDDHP